MERNVVGGFPMSAMPKQVNEPIPILGALVSFLCTANANVRVNARGVNSIFLVQLRKMGVRKIP